MNPANAGRASETALEQPSNTSSDAFFDPNRAEPIYETNPDSQIPKHFSFFQGLASPEFEDSIFSAIWDVYTVFISRLAGEVVHRIEFDSFMADLNWFIRPDGARILVLALTIAPVDRQQRKWAALEPELYARINESFVNVQKPIIRFFEGAYELRRGPRHPREAW